MSPSVEFTTHVDRMIQYFEARKLNRQARHYVAMAKLELETRHRSVRLISRRAYKLLQMYEAGASAYLRGHCENDCPHFDRLDRAAWRSGWVDMEIRLRIHVKLASPAPLLIDNERYR